MEGGEDGLVDLVGVHVDFPLLQRIALPITIGSVRYPASKSTIRGSSAYARFSSHGGTHVAVGLQQIHQAVLTTFHLSDKGYGLNQLRYDLRQTQGSRTYRA